MRSGKLREKISFIALTGTSDGQGGTGPVIESTFATAWAHFAPQRAVQVYKSGQIENPVETVCRTRYLSTLIGREDLTLRHSGIDYDIISIVDLDSRRKEIEIRAKRQVR